MESNNINVSFESNVHFLEESDDCLQIEQLGATDEKKPCQSKNRKLTSKLWTFFERLLEKNSSDGKSKVKCKLCGYILNYESKYGTGNLKRHNDNCVRKDTRDIGQMIFSKEHNSMLMRSSKFDLEKFRELVVATIVMHNLPLSFVEYIGTKSMLSYLREDVVLISRNTVKADIIKMHKREKYGLKEVDSAIQKVRESIKYVKGSQGRKQKFLECVSLVNLNAKRSLKQDVPTWWNSTFPMLESALYFRLAFSYLEISDSNFKHSPSRNKWDRIEKLSKFLSVFYEITCVFSETKYPTTDLYFPSIFMARMTLEEHMSGDDVYLKNMATQMFFKFEKYWSEISLILAIAVIFDYRYKIQFVEWSYAKFYGSDSAEFKKVQDHLFSLYDEYAVKVSNTLFALNDIPFDEKNVHKGKNEFLKEFDNFQREFGTAKNKSQLEQYLDEQTVETTIELDILQFWKTNQFRHPEVSAMTRDILAIPVSIVASEFAFSVGAYVETDMNSLTADVINLEISKEEMSSAECSTTVDVD
ncbi:BED zinc finger,hAT family dimerization domain [Theobroma cacao]|uniref:BED zinc finger,hAT family dimerization domain n=1 Tax=Theobroma cacao TaxID=3641 RepID=A0A061E4Z7_THECC|nr:BED zinc finger,hAT family dimerization domain [Theobroma cacao]